MDEKPKLWSPRPGEHGMTELHYAAYCQDLGRVKECVEAGASIHEKDEAGYTALAWCIDMAATGEKGAAEGIVDYLVSQGAKLEFRDKRYRTIVDFARACDGYVADHIEALLKKKKANRPNKRPDRTRLDAARKSGSPSRA